MTIRCAGLTALAISAFAATTAAAPVLSSSTMPSDFADGLTLVASPTIVGLFSPALAHGIPSQNSSRGTKVVPSVPFNTASSSLMGVLAPQPALLEGSGKLLTFFVGGEQVAPLTEDQTWDVIAGIALVSGAPPFYVYVTRAHQRVQVMETTINAPGISKETTIDAPGISIDTIGGLAGLGLLAMAALVAVCLKHTGKWHVPRLERLDQKAKLEEEHQEYRHAYAEHRGFNSDGASSTDLAMLGLRHPFTRQDVRRAFRAKAWEAHPDRGGDPDFFRSLVIARDRSLAGVDDDEPKPVGSQPTPP
jgi:hypothetical protein